MRNREYARASFVREDDRVSRKSECERRDTHNSLEPYVVYFPSVDSLLKGNIPVLATTVSHEDEQAQEAQAHVQCIHYQYSRYHPDFFPFYAPLAQLVLIIGTPIVSQKVIQNGVAYNSPQYHNTQDLQVSLLGKHSL